MEAGAVPRITAPRLPALTPRLIRLASDGRLVALVREGRAGAFEALYDRHHRAILSFCRHLLGDQYEAEDVVQHTFMAAYTSLLASQQPIQLRPWLFTIARNRCYSVLRSRRERPTAELEEPVTDGLAGEVQRRQDLRDLLGDLRRLPDEQRAAIVLAELDSLSHADIAEVLDVPRDKVKALVFQARQSLLASRTARDTSCQEIRQQLAGARGGALRRSNLRRHLRDCESCRAYRADVQRQRRQFAALLPVAPTLLLKEGALAVALGAGGAAAVGGSGLIAGSALKTGFLKGVAAALIAGAGTLGTVVVSTSDLPVRSLAGSSSGSAARAAGSHRAHRAPAGHGIASAPSSSAAVPVAQLDTGAPAATTTGSRSRGVPAAHRSAGRSAGRAGVRAGGKTTPGHRHAKSPGRAPTTAGTGTPGPGQVLGTPTGSSGGRLDHGQPRVWQRWSGSSAPGPGGKPSVIGGPAAGHTQTAGGVPVRSSWFGGSVPSPGGSGRSQAWGQRAGTGRRQAWGQGGGTGRSQAWGQGGGTRAAHGNGHGWSQGGGARPGHGNGHGWSHQSTGRLR